MSHESRITRTNSSTNKRLSIEPKGDQALISQMKVMISDQLAPIIKTVDSNAALLLGIKK